MTVDPDKNARGESMISVADAGCLVRVVPADEALVIAGHTAAVVAVN